MDYRLYKTKYKNISIYDISYNTFMDSIPLHIRFDKEDWFFKIYDGIKYLLIFGHCWFDEICDRMKYYSKNLKSCITDSINHHFVTIRIGSYNSLPNRKNIDFS